MFQFLIAEPDQCLERNLITEPVIIAQFEDFRIDKAFDQPEYVGIGTAWIWLTNRFSFAERVVNSSANERLSGRNLVAVSNKRPRITSLLTSHRTFLDD
jgi:hypothetical protein